MDFTVLDIHIGCLVILAEGHNMSYFAAVSACHLCMPRLWLFRRTIIGECDSLIVTGATSVDIISFPLGQVVIDLGNVLRPFVATCP
jgi:hypothetical protein